MSVLAAAHYRSVLAAGSKSFSFASRFLPADRRDDAAVVYTFCRSVDDIADESSDPVQAGRELQAVRDELAGHVAARSWVDAFVEVARRRSIDLRAAHHLIDGAESDLAGVRLADDGALIRYCYQVAGTVGLMMCGVLGVTDPEATPFAVDLGIAMQLTNILRDVREDALRGRVYLPEARLREHGLQPEDLLQGAGRPESHPSVAARLRPMVLELLELADRYYDSSVDGLRYIPARPRWAILVASRVYRQIGRRLARVHHADPLHGRTVVPGIEKLGAAAVALALGSSPRVLGWRTPRPRDRALHRGLGGLPGAEAPRQLEAVT